MVAGSHLGLHTRCEGSVINHTLVLFSTFGTCVVGLCRGCAVLFPARHTPSPPFHRNLSAEHQQAAIERCQQSEKYSSGTLPLSKFPHLPVWPDSPLDCLCRTCSAGLGTIRQKLHETSKTWPSLPRTRIPNGAEDPNRWNVPLTGSTAKLCS